MIAQAQRLCDTDAAAAKSGSKEEESGAGVTFLLKDCAVPEKYPGGGRSMSCLELGCFNYAKDKAGLVRMFRTVAGNLKSGGVFVKCYAADVGGSVGVGG